MGQETLRLGAPIAAPIARPGASRAAQLRALRLALVAADALALALAFGLAYWIRFDVRLALAPEIAPSVEFYTRLMAVLIPVWLGLFGLFGLYDFQLLLGGTTEYAHAFNACTSGMMLVVLATFLDPTFVIARGWLVSAWLLSALLVGVARFAIRHTVYALRQRGYFLAPTLLVGVDGEALALAEQLHGWRSSGLYVVGFVDGDRPVGNMILAGLPMLGRIQDVEDVVLKYSIEEVVVATTAIRRAELLDLFDRLTGLPGVQLRLSSGLFEVLTTGVRVQKLGFVPLMSLSPLRLDRVEYTLKTTLDYAVAVPALVLLAPLFLVIAALVKLDSPGPIFHRRRVMGVGGREFDAFKFRTMCVDGDSVLSRCPELVAELRANGKLKADPRVTRFGRRLRRYSLDELPQLFNVVLGQMSLVGPRMITPVEAAKYGRLWHNLLTVKPGITGLWQVSGRADVSYEERVRLDMHYIRNYTIWQDLQILFFQTLPAVLKGKGAY